MTLHHQTIEPIPPQTREAVTLYDLDRLQGTSDGNL